MKLGVRYPSSGGIIAYLLEGFGNGRLVGIVIMDGLLRGDPTRRSDDRGLGRRLRVLAVHRHGAAKGWSKLFASLIVVARGSST